MISGSIVTIRYGSPLRVSSVVPEVRDNAKNYEGLRLYLANLFDGVAAVNGSSFVVSVESVNSGSSVAPSPSVNVVLTSSMIANGQTLTIGAKTLTWLTGAVSNNEQVRIGGTNFSAAVSLAAVVNAHPVLGNVFSASYSGSFAGGARVTLTYPYAGVEASLVGISSNTTGSIVSTSSFAPGGTYSLGLGPVFLKKGV